MSRRWVFPLIALPILLCSVAASATTLKVDVGWDGRYRGGHWAPVFVTISDEVARPVTIEVRAPHSQNFGMLVAVQVSASPTPATYPIYVPMPATLMDLMVVVRDARTERRLAEWPTLEELGQMMLADAAVQTMIGTSGRGPTLRPLASDAHLARVAVPFVDPAALPVHPIGYDSFNALVLNQPDLNRMSADQQHAIIEWVSAGGQLILWAGADPVDPTSPLAAMLPCTIGPNTTLNLDPAIVTKAGLNERFAKMPARELAPRTGSQAIRLFDGNDSAPGYRAARGFGQIIVLPFDPGLFVFASQDHSKAFWRPILAGIVEFSSGEENQPFAGRMAPMHRRARAFTALADVLGNVPGVGQFGFSYVAIILIALMVVVGPVDWFVLKYLGLQPWTWFTTTGWIVLVTTGAIFAGSMFKSGDLHFRTLRVIDQADGRVVGSLELACIYSPRTRYYNLNVPRESWWQPGTEYAWGTSGIRYDMHFVQDWRSNRPAPMRVAVWNLRFLESDSIGAAPPMIEATLRRYQNADGNPCISGTIRNLSAQTLKNIKIRSRHAGGPYALSVNATEISYNESPLLGRLAPEQTVEIDIPLDQKKIAADRYNARDSQEIWIQADELALDRGMRIDAMLHARNDVVCIHAEIENPAPATTLADGGAIEQHWQFLRALVPVTVFETP